MTGDGDVIVIGAGIAGLTTALALARNGIPVSVFEKAPALTEVGAGLSLSPNAVRALDALGLREALARVADTPREGLIRHYQTAEPLLVVDRDDSFGSGGRAGFFQLHRADFIAVLVAALATEPRCRLHLDHALVELTDGPAHVEAVFGNGARHAGRVLVGCDGLRSVTRGTFMVTEAPRFTGQVAFRCVVPRERIALRNVANACGVFIGPGRMLNIYPIRNGALLNCVGIVRTDDWRDEGWLCPSSVAELLAHFPDWYADVRAVLGAAPPDAVFKWALFDRDPITVWGSGRVTLAGDAAHPMLPFLGMGAAMGIEDALVLARSLARVPADPAAGLRLYEATRRDRCRAVLLDSRAQGQRYQAGDPAAYAATGRELRVRYFAYDPVSVPLGAPT